MAETIFNPDQRLTRKQKNASNKLWYRETLDTLDRVSFANGGLFGFSELGTGISEYRRMKVNYDLFNGIINKTDFERITHPYGRDFGEMPADFTNKDILSGKVKAILGMEMRRPFGFKVVATNEEATTRIEQESFGRLRDYVVNSIIQPIKQQIELKYQQEAQGRELTPDEQRNIQQQVEQELQSQTPPEVKKYMQRQHQDPAEALAFQILQYLLEKENIRMKFNKAFKHGLISGREIFWVGIVNGEPVLRVVNPLRFDYDKSPDLDFIEEGEWASYEMYMTPSDIVKNFGADLTTKEIDNVYKDYSHASSLPDSSFTFRNDGTSAVMGIRVLHAEWKSLKPIKFVYGIDPNTGEEYEDIVDEEYQLTPEVGDIRITTEWIPTKYEGYKIGKDTYAYLREVPGQYKDLDNLYNCKLSFIGAAYDNLNSETTSLVDRMKFYQYMYNVIQYRIELLLASDEGKLLFMNADFLPKTAGMDVEKWMYYLKVNKLGLVQQSEEGKRMGIDVSQSVKEVDMSLVSDIQKYIELAEYIEQRCGQSVGITKQIEGQIGTSEAVRNTQQALIQSANILEPYFELHNHVKRNVLQALIETAKVAYSEFQPKKLSYILDDMSKQMIEMDYEMLDNSTYGVFVSNSMKADEALQMVQQLSHAALQNQSVELSDVVKIMRSESIQEAEELLMTAESNRIEREQAQQQQQLQAQAEEAQRERDYQFEVMDKEHENTMEEIQLKGDIDLQKQVILSMGFNEDKDLDKDGTPDILEVYRAGVDADIQQQKIDLERDKMLLEDKQHKEKLKVETQKIKSQVAKAKTTAK